VENPEHGVFGRSCWQSFEEVKEMAEGTIKRLTDKGFGFIDTGTDQDMFFHSSSLQGVSYEELQEGQRVSYTEGQGPKGPRAENVTLI
jgi:CspA family cold shock protein